MKRVLMFLMIALCLSTFKLMGQSALIPRPTTADYSTFYQTSSGLVWRLTGIAHDDNLTGLFFRIDIRNNKKGFFIFPNNIYIEGEFGFYHPIGLKVNGQDSQLGQLWSYEDGNKGIGVDVLLLFPRIPAGVSSINYCEPNFIRWDNIPITDNPDPAEKTGWTDATLRAHWSQNKCLPIEGIYLFTNTTKKEWWGENKHTFAVIKDNYQYKLIYLRGIRSGVWQEGDVKAVFIPTATKGLYKATSWLMDNKMNNEDFYLKFSEGSMTIYENTSNVTADFLKLFPAVDENLESATYHPSTRSDSETQSSSISTTGSGIFIADKVVVTNNHLISEAKKIDVIIKDGNNVSTYTAKVLSTDKTNDLALLSIEDEKFAGIGHLPFAISTRTRDVGTAIFTMGYPMATYMGEEVKITDGIINSKTGYEGDIVTYQISAPIQPGSSGGPLFDKAGYMIGITTAGIRNAQNVGYAIKGSYLCNLIESAPVNINIPENNTIDNMELTEQIKQLSKYVVFIKVY